MLSVRSWFAGDLFDDGNFVGAQKAYIKILEENPNDLDTHYDLFDCFKENGDLDSAEAISRAAIVLEAKDGMTKLHQGYCRLGDCLHAKGDFHGACVAFQKAQQLENIDAESLTKYARCMRAMGSVNETEVSKLLHQANKLFRKRISQISKLEGREVAEGSNYLTSNDAFRRTRSLVNNNFGICLYKQKQYSAAKSVFQEAVKAEPGNSSAQANLKDCDSDDDDDDKIDSDEGGDKDDDDVVIHDGNTEETGQDFNNEEYDDDNITDSDEEEYDEDYEEYEDYDELRERDQNDFDFNLQNLTRD